MHALPSVGMHPCRPRSLSTALTEAAGPGRHQEIGDAAFESSNAVGSMATRLSGNCTRRRLRMLAKVNAPTEVVALARSPTT